MTRLDACIDPIRKRTPNGGRCIFDLLIMLGRNRLGTSFVRSFVNQIDVKSVHRCGCAHVIRFMAVFGLVSLSLISTLGAQPASDHSEDNEPPRIKWANTDECEAGSCGSTDFVRSICESDIRPLVSINFLTQSHTQPLSITEFGMKCCNPGSGMANDSCNDDSEIYGAIVFDNEIDAYPRQFRLKMYDAALNRSVLSQTRRPNMWSDLAVCRESNSLKVIAPNLPSGIYNLEFELEEVEFEEKQFSVVLKSNIRNNIVTQKAKLRKEKWDRNSPQQQAHIELITKLQSSQSILSKQKGALYNDLFADEHVSRIVDASKLDGQSARTWIDMKLRSNDVRVKFLIDVLKRMKNQDTPLKRGKLIEYFEYIFLADRDRIYAKVKPELYVDVLAESEDDEKRISEYKDLRTWLRCEDHAGPAPIHWRIREAINCLGCSLHSVREFAPSESLQLVFAVVPGGGSTFVEVDVDRTNPCPDIIKGVKHFIDITNGRTVHSRCQCTNSCIGSGTVK